MQNSILLRHDIPQPSGQLPVAVGTVKIIGVDDGEGTVQQLPGSVDRLPGAPGLGTSRRTDEGGRQVIQTLKRIIHFDPVRITAADRPPELLLNIPANHENHPIEPRPHGVENRIVHDRFPGGSEWIKLLKSAVTASHARGKNNESKFHPVNLSVPS